MPVNIRNAVWSVVVLAGVLLAILPEASRAVPSYARQTNIPCLSCHTVFPALTPFGRQFKLNGYVANAGEVIESKEYGVKPDSEEEVLTLGKVPPISVMLLTSWTSTHKTQTGAEQNGDLLFPDQFSFFLAGQIAPKAGAFMQVTYEATTDHFSWDNTDIRAATTTSMGEQTFLYGVSLNNNPTVQDVWNSTPAWGYPYAASPVAPSPAAVTMIDGMLAQQVAGLSVYTLWNNLFYAELGAYHASPVGTSRPLSGTCGTATPPCTAPAEQVVEGVAPYWRLALQKQFGEHNLMVGAYGMNTRILPGNPDPLSGASNRFNDIALDLQYEKPFGENFLTLHSTWIHESQDWLAGGSTNQKDKLDVFRVDANYNIKHRYAGILGFFSTTGSSDAGLYGPSGLYGSDSANGSPDSSGMLAELDWLPWLNTKFGLQYTAYNKFDGASSNYDGAGRNAHDNNTTYAYIWLIF
jgi:hypothetical protein